MLEVGVNTEGLLVWLVDAEVETVVLGVEGGMVIGVVELACAVEAGVEDELAVEVVLGAGAAEEVFVPALGAVVEEPVEVGGLGEVGVAELD